MDGAYQSGRSGIWDVARPTCDCGPGRGTYALEGGALENNSQLNLITHYTGSNTYVI